MSKKVRCLNLEKSLLNKLLKNCFNICQDILLKVPQELANILSISYSEALVLLQLASQASSVQPITVLELMRKRRDKSISSGLPLLDKMLSCGLPIASLTEVAGPPGCGKTQFCLSIAASILTDDDKKSIIYIDTEGSFDPVRLLQIAHYKYPNIYSNKINGESALFSQDLIDGSQQMDFEADKNDCDEYNYEKLSDLANRLIYLRETTCNSLIKRLDDLEGMILESNATLIIIDSIASIIRHDFDCSSINITHQRNKVLIKIVSHLKLLAENYNIPIIAVNQITTNFNNNKRKLHEIEVAGNDVDSMEDEPNVTIALGPTWTHAVNSRIVLQFSEGLYDRQMLLVKSPNAPQSKLNYTIGPSGIVISENDSNSLISIDVNDFKIRMRSGIIY